MNLMEFDTRLCDERRKEACVPEASDMAKETFQNAGDDWRSKFFTRFLLNLQCQLLLSLESQLYKLLLNMKLDSFFHTPTNINNNSTKSLPRSPNGASFSVWIHCAFNWTVEVPRKFRRIHQRANNAKAIERMNFMCSQKVLLELFALNRAIKLSI